MVKVLAELDQRVVLLQRASAAKARGRLPPAGAMGRAGSEVARTVRLDPLELPQRRCAV